MLLKPLHLTNEIENVTNEFAWAWGNKIVNTHIHKYSFKKKSLVCSISINA